MGFLPAGVQPADLAMEPPEPPMLPPMPGEEEPEDDGEEPEEPPQKSKGVLPRAITWSLYKPRLKGYELAMARRMQSVYHQAEKYVLEQVKRMAPVAKAGDTDIAGLLPPDFRRSVKNAAEPIIRRATLEGGTSALIEIGKDAEFDAADPLVQAQITRRMVMVEQTTETFQRRLNDTVFKAMQDNAGDAEMKKVIEDLFDSQDFHLRTIGRTEASAAFNGGRFEAMQQVGVQRHMWLTAGDELVRDSHAKLDGAVAVLGTNDWAVDGNPVSTPLRYPLDPTAPAHEVCNCRCVTVAVEEE
jgi:SPP1 gp7 family putative phage head morphogenesis protein